MPSQIPLDLSTVAPLRARIDRWRETRTHRGAPMPMAVWAAVVDVARQYGLGPTARALRVDYGTLKRRLAAAAPSGPAVGAPTFVDVGPVGRLGLGPCVVAIEGPGGRRLRVEVSDLAGSDLLALVHAAWGREA